MVLTGYTGVVLRTDSDQADAVHHVRLRYDPFARRPEVIGARWLALEGCFQASRGGLDSWLEGLPGRVLA